MAEMREAIDMIHAARRLLQRINTPGEKVEEGEILTYLADSESFLAEGCGHRPRYFKPKREEGA